jgi:hypothetical protein
LLGIDPARLCCLCRRDLTAKFPSKPGNTICG